MGEQDRNDSRKRDGIERAKPYLAALPSFMEAVDCMRCLGGGFFHFDADKQSDGLVYSVCGQCDGYGFVARMRTIYPAV